MESRGVTAKSSTQTAIHTRFWILNKLEQEVPRHQHSSNLVCRSVLINLFRNVLLQVCKKAQSHCIWSVLPMFTFTNCRPNRPITWRNGRNIPKLKNQSQEITRNRIILTSKNLLNILLSFWAAMVVLKSSSLWPSSWHQSLNESLWGYLNHCLPKPFHLHDFDTQSCSVKPSSDERPGGARCCHWLHCWLYHSGCASDLRTVKCGGGYSCWESGLTKRSFFSV